MLKLRGPTTDEYATSQLFLLAVYSWTSFPLKSTLKSCCVSERTGNVAIDVDCEITSDSSFRSSASILSATEGAEEFPQSAAKAYLLLLCCRFVKRFSLLCVTDG